MERPLYAYEYAEVAYEDATELLGREAASLLQDATDATVEHAEQVVTELHVELAGFEVGREVVIEVGEFEPVEMLRGRLPLSWTAARRAGLFPAVTAHREVAALSLQPPRTPFTLVGGYEPPLGPVGAAGDAAVGHRVAEAAIERFVEDVTRRLTHRVATSDDLTSRTG